ncbi:MAG: NAD-dependent epimerase/dehydratase family protein, partial [Gammaproteobacteria bacterium]
MKTIWRRFVGHSLASLLVLASGAGAGAVPREVLVLGGTGQLGAEIVRRLVDRGDAVTVFTRPGSSRGRLDGLPVKYVEGDLLNKPDVAAAFAGRRFQYVIVAVRVETGDSHFYEKFLPAVT